jgi:hypothetical protein
MISEAASIFETFLFLLKIIMSIVPRLITLLPLFSPYIEQGEISNLPAFNFYAKLSAVKAQEPLSAQTVLLADDGSSKVRTAIIEHSRLVFAKKQEVIEKEKEQPKPSNAKVEKNKKEGLNPSLSLQVNR